MSPTDSFWPRFDILAKAFAAIVLPITIGILGYYHNREEKESNTRDLKLRDSVATLERQADRLTNLLEHLSSDNARRRTMAIRVAEELSLRNQLPPEIVPVLTDLANASGGDTAERAAARAAVALVSAGDDRRRELLRRLFAPDSKVRIPASDALVSSWRDDPEVVPALIRNATGNSTNENGVYNTLGVLLQICPEGTRRNASDVIAFADRFRTAGPRTKALAGRVKACVQSSATPRAP